MSGNWEMSEQEDEDKAEVKEENESKPSALEHLKLDETDTQASANIAEGQELKVLPENNEEQDRVVEADTIIQSLPRATTTTATMEKRKKRRNYQSQQKQKRQQRRKEITMPNVSKQLHKQGVEIKKLKSILQSQSQVIKQIQSQLKQVTKYTSKIQKHTVTKKKRK